MTLDQLLAFRAVVTEGTFAAAARALHKSQPAVSKLVQNLESELGFLLLDRSSYRPTLSARGKLFHERAALMLADSESLASFAVALRAHAEPSVRLVLEAVTPLAPVLAALREVQSTFPQVRYELRTERLAGALEALQDASADLVIASDRGMDRRSMEARHYADVRIVAVARHDHPLVGAGAPVPAAALRKHPQVVLRDSARRDATHSLNVLRGGLRWTVTDLAAKQQIIESGLGWGGLPAHMAERGMEAGTLVALDVREFEVTSIALFTLRRRDTPAGAVVQTLWSRLHARA